MARSSLPDTSSGTSTRPRCAASRSARRSAPTSRKSSRLFDQGIKVLSLFFIDEVAKYRTYDENGEQPGEYAQVFEEEYTNLLNEVLELEDSPYQRYLKKIEAVRTHNGYFSIDKKSKLTDPTIKARGEGAGTTDDVDAYDLILRDKERLLSFEEDTRFIFSHSALREGWDNPNVFVICTLKHSDNTISRRQEVGRGMRLCVNQFGERIDNPATAHQINVLTVVANEILRGLRQRTPIRHLRLPLSPSPQGRRGILHRQSAAWSLEGQRDDRRPPAMAKKIHRYF